ncbi:MAG: hypothetical protein H6977_03145 [Gammaproteobacteria bacterium]|nr:hypothetical protein [Gammaproteobacteria bacterium]MCP5198983.1 hypothetical protein [Gammaproteobacteria bacterium]
MTTLAELGAAVEAPDLDAAAMLALGEAVLEAWHAAHERTPTAEQREGFRLLALHRQGAKTEPSFNACRETCRELAWHYNLLTLEPDHAEREQRLAMMRFALRHLFLFVSGKLEQAGLGDFCCASRPLRLSAKEQAESA